MTFDMLSKVLFRLAVFLFLTGTAHAGCSIGSLPFVLQNGTIADADQVMANFNAIVSSVQSHCASAGVNSDITALSGLTSPISPTLGGSVNFFGTGGGTGNAQSVVVIYPGGGWSLTPGYTITWTPAQANAGSATLSVGGTAAKLLVKQVGYATSVLQGGELQPNYAVTATYTGPNYELRALPSQIATGGTAGITQGQARTNLGAAASGANSDITSLSSLSTPLSIPQGGTGVASLPSGFLIGNGTGPITTGGSFPITVPNGGTGLTSLTAGSFLLGNGASAVAFTPSPLGVAVGGTGTTNFGLGGFLATSGGTSAFQAIQAPIPSVYGGTGVSGPAGILVGQGASPVTTITPPIPVSFGGTGLGTLPAGQLLTGNGTGNVGSIPIATPLVRVYTSGSGTDTPSIGTIYQQLLFCGGGGGGSGTGGNGGPGGTTTVSGISANGGSGGSNTGGTGGAGGTGSTGASVDFPGLAAPNGMTFGSLTGTNLPGTCGRATVYPPYGVGGCGGVTVASGSGQQQTGGGSADCKMLWASATAWTYAIGTGGTAGTGTGSTAGNAGVLIVQDFTH